MSYFYMFEQLFLTLDFFENYLWGYIAFPLIMLLGFYLTMKSSFFQIRKFGSILRMFTSLLKVSEETKRGVHPLKAFFAGIGGCVGVGNVAAICTAVQIGGPGALFWIWVTAIAGMLVKYAEVYLGLRYRVLNGNGGYNGGPMYFLTKVFKQKWVPNLVSLLLCLYGVEVYQFSVVTNSVVQNLHINQYIVVFLLLGMVLFAGSGGVSRVGAISSAVIPVFVVLYVSMGMWVLINNFSDIPAIVQEVFTSAFTGYAAFGGFAGSSLLMTISHGVRRGCYTGDFGIGYASVIHSESSISMPEKQAALVIFEVFLDTFVICTTSVMLILVTGVWHQPLEASMMVQTALGHYFPYMTYFMPFFLFLLGYSTINAYFCVGLKCASLLGGNVGRYLYYVYATAALLFFSFVDTTEAQSMMAIVGGLLLTINCYGIFRLRNEISFNFGDEREAIAQTVVA